MAITSKLSPLGILQFFEDDLTFLSGGKLIFKVAGSSTLATTYQDYALTIPHANPIILNSRGETAIASGAATPVYLDPRVSYKIILARSTDDSVNPTDPFWTVDNVTITDIDSLSSLLKTGNYTLTSGDHNKYLLVDTSSGNVSITAPAISSLFDGYTIYVHKLSGLNTVTFSPNVANTVNGQTNMTLTVANERVMYVVANGAWYADTPVILRDSNGKIAVNTTATASAVNYTNVTTSATGNAPTFEYTGSDATVSGILGVKGATGALTIRASTNTVLKLNGQTSSVNNFEIDNAATGSPPILRATGSDTNVGLFITTKGTGQANIDYSDARTNTVARPFVIRGLTSGTAANNFGVGISYVGENSAGTNQAIGGIDFIYGNITPGAERTTFGITALHAGTLSQRWAFSTSAAGGLQVIDSAATTTRTVSLPDRNLDFANAMIMAWIRFNGSTGAITSSFNVSSVSKGGTGVYTITYSTSITNGIVVGNTDAAGGVTVQSSGTSNTVINTFTTTTAVLTDFTTVYVAVIGR